MRVLILVATASALWAQDDAGSWNDLAMKYAQKARESSDYSWYAKADNAITKSLAIAPDNFGANKAQVWIWLGGDEYEKALALATKLNKQVPDDVMIRGYMADAQYELGQYDAAVDSVQWMLRLRAGNSSALARVGKLREVHGDLNGARDVVRMAYEATPPNELFSRAALLAQLARIEWLAGEYDQAEAVANQSLKAAAEFAPALEVLGQVRMAQKRYADAAEYYSRRYNAARHPENLYPLAEALAKSGQDAKAHQAFAQFEREALAESERADNANRELIAYYIDYAHQPAKALTLAKREIARRRDVYTSDAYAWALYANGDAAAAQAAIRPALDLRVKDPVILKHAAAMGATGAPLTFAHK